MSGLCTSKIYAVKIRVVEYTTSGPGFRPTSGILSIAGCDASIQPMYIPHDD